MVIKNLKTTKKGEKIILIINRINLCQGFKSHSSENDFDIASVAPLTYSRSDHGCIYCTYLFYFEQVGSTYCHSNIIRYVACELPSCLCTRQLEALNTVSPRLICYTLWMNFATFCSAKSVFVLMQRTAKPRINGAVYGSVVIYAFELCLAAVKSKLYLFIKNTSILTHRNKLW